MRPQRSRLWREAAGGADTAAAEAWKTPPRWLPPTLHSLAYRNFVFLFLGQVSNSLAQWMDQVARPILVIAITGSAVQLGLVTLARGLPSMLMGPIGGLLADRIDRRLVLLVVKCLTLAVNAAFAAIILSGHLQLWHIYATGVLKSLLMAFDQPARQSLLPALVPPSLLMNAIGLNTGSMQLTRILSASVAGFLIALWAAAFGFSIDDARAFGGVYLAVAVSYIVAIVATYLMRVPEGGRVERTADSWATSLVEGVRFVWHNPVILGILALFAIQSLFGMPYLQVFVPWLAIRVMDMGPQGAGMLMAVSGFGSLAGAVGIATVGWALHRRGLLVVAGMVIFGAALVALGLTSNLPPTAVLLLGLPILPALMIILVGLAQTVIMSLKNALLLEATSNELRGRVMSLYHMDRGFSTMGSSAGGFAIAALGGPYALALFGALCVLGTLVVGALSPALRKAD